MAVGPYKAPDPITVLIDQSVDDDLTTEIDLGEFTLAAIITPSSWTAANIRFEAAEKSGGTFADLYDSDGNQVIVQAAASRCLGLTGNQASALAPCRFVKIGTTAGQAADRTLYLLRAAT